jgi:hypothetical protein
MWLKTVIILLSFSFMGHNPAMAQETPSYENIESYSGSGKFTQFMYRLFYKPVASAPTSMEQKVLRPKVPYSAFEGKTIRKITITILNPFGYSLGDTTTNATGHLSNIGNKLHIPTREAILRHNLLIKEGQVFDSLLIKESERLVRSGKHLTDVAFWVVIPPESPDSVDVIIHQLDKWSILPGGAITDKELRFRLGDNNFLGLGHAFQNEVIQTRSTSEYDFKTSYHIPNIYNSHIQSTLIYETNLNENYIRSAALERPFFSTYTKWAGGISFSQIARNDSAWSGSYSPYIFKSQDYWAGKASPLFHSSTEFCRTTRLVKAIRYNRIRYIKEPPKEIDTHGYYSDEDFYLASLGISTRIYVKEHYLFNFGLTEYVATGRIINLTSGFRQKNNTGMLYYGARYSSGKYYPWGYFSPNLELGTFIHKSKTQEGVLSLELDYFTKLMELGRWKLRQFVKPSLIIGFNRYSYDRLNLKKEYGLERFNMPLRSGNSRLLFTSQTQTYAPWDFIGFHFGPYLTLSLGILGDAKEGLQAGRLHSKIALGVLIKNDNLAMNTFQLSVAYYPVIPGMENNQLKFNPIQTFDFGLPDFEIEKPGKVAYW